MKRRMTFLQLPAVHGRFAAPSTGGKLARLLAHCGRAWSVSDD